MSRIDRVFTGKWIHEPGLSLYRSDGELGSHVLEPWAVDWGKTPEECGAFAKETVAAGLLLLWATNVYNHLGMLIVEVKNGVPEIIDFAGMKGGITTADNLLKREFARPA